MFHELFAPFNAESAVCWPNVIWLLIGPMFLQEAEIESV
jgi:hypothetical protein